MARFKAGYAAALAVVLATPAVAQFGNIFGPPPRPPANVPAPTYQQDERLPPRPVRPPPQREEAEPPPPPLTRLPPGSAPPPPAPPPGQPAGRQPLPSPPGAPPQQNAQPAPAEPQGTPGQSPLAGLPPGQRQPRPSAPPNPNGDEVVVAPPKQRIVNNTATFSGLDKITGRIISFDVAIDETVQFGALRLTPRACYTRPPNEMPNTDSFIEVDEITLQGEVKRIFTGWMFAASPGLHGVEHPIYDVWLADCKGPTQVAGAEPPPPPVPAAAPAPAPRPQRPPPQRSQPRPPPQQPLPPPGAPRGF